VALLPLWASVACSRVNLLVLAPSINAKTGWMKFDLQLTEEANRMPVIKQIWNKRIDPHLLPISTMQFHLQSKHQYKWKFVTF
jgi:hypothetical protein